MNACMRLVTFQSCITTISLGVCPEKTKDLRRITLMKGNTLALALAKSSTQLDSVCPVYRQAQMYCIPSWREPKYVRFICVNIRTLTEIEFNPKSWKYVRFIGMNVRLGISVLSGRTKLCPVHRYRGSRLRANGPCIGEQACFDHQRDG